MFGPTTPIIYFKRHIPPFYFRCMNRCDIDFNLVHSVVFTSVCHFKHSRTMNKGPSKDESIMSFSTKAFCAVLIVFGGIYFMRPFLLGSFFRRVATMSSDYVSGTHSMAFVTVPNEEVAKKLARGLVENKLVACVNIIPKITSVYEWKGNIEEDSELLLMLKTRTSRVPDVAKFVKENHPYDVPEVISTPIDQGHAPYLEWLGQIVAEK